MKAVRGRTRPGIKPGLSSLEEVKDRLLADPEVRFHYDTLRIREEIGQAVAVARKKAGLTQAEVAKRAQTTQSVIARLETGRGGVPSLQLLDKVAQALGLTVSIRLERRRVA